MKSPNKHTVAEENQIIYALKAMPWFGVCKTPERSRAFWPLETDSLDWAWSGYPNAVDENE